MSKEDLLLVSFNVCPFVHRVAGALIEKDTPYEIEYIDLKQKPDWFLEISPLGRVPLIKTEGQVLFESVAILEYLEERYNPALHPHDPVARARDRAWIQHSESVFIALYRWCVAGADEGQQATETLIKKLKPLENEPRLQAAPYFHGKSYHMIDLVYMPLLYRLHITEGRRPVGIFDELPKIKTWAEGIARRPSTKASVLDDFDTLYVEWIAQSGGFWSALKSSA